MMLPPIPLSSSSLLLSASSKLRRCINRCLSLSCYITPPSCTINFLQHQSSHYRYNGTTTTTSSNNGSNNKHHPTIHDAIIIGGGPTGLLLSNLLSNYNSINKSSSQHLLFDKRPMNELLLHPQAHFINIRSMELLKSELPNVYNGVIRDMPIVDEWDGFHFGGSVLEMMKDDNDDNDGTLSLGGRRLGRVVHPVRELLKEGQTGDAMLVPKATIQGGGGDMMTPSPVSSEDFISSCRPAHLAQNKFVSLLLQEARRHCEHDDDEIEDSPTHLRYGEEVIGVSEYIPKTDNNNNNNNYQSPIITIHTSKGQSYHTRYLLAADGANSFIRKQYSIPMLGDSSLQNLINVHFRTNNKLSKLLMDRSSSNNQAMLHFVYNSQVVGAFVCHDGNEGEWVLQVPFFPPFQTVEVDFDEIKVRDMVWAGLVGTGHQSATDTEDLDFDILSIRPWTMSSMVAQTYLNESKNMILVGDAAHAFPPAGGFGMNTGLQDAQNIAWRLALALRRRKVVEEIDPSSSRQKSATECKEFIDNILSKYESERKPVATQNAALSVRNYQRTLRIAKACYLDAQHPQLLTAMLSSPPMSMLAIETRQEMFRKLVQVAMLPLGSLCSKHSEGGKSLHADHIEKNVRSILESGGSLPLVFPRYELGFSYDNVATTNISSDTAGYVPQLRVGHRMPHVLVELLEETHDKATITTQQCWDLTYISSQIQQLQHSSSPTFTLLVVGQLTKDMCKAVRRSMEQWNIPIFLVHVHSDKSSGKSKYLTLPNDIIHVVDKEQKLLRLLQCEMNKQLINDQREKKDVKACEINAIIMVRPDGHICQLHCYLEDEEGFGVTTAEQLIKQGIQNALGVELSLETEHVA